MPVTYVVDRDQRVIRTTVTGTVATDEFIPYLEALADGGLLGWPRIVDARSAALRITPQDVRRFVHIVDALRTRHGIAR